MNRIPFLLRLARVPAALLVLCGGAFGYYHFVHFTAGDPYSPLFERFDVGSLPGGTVQFFISSQGPSALAPGDSLNAVISEIRAAAKVWSDVPTSTLRIAYGGVATADTAQATPGIDVIFSDEIPPGLIALGGPSSRGGPATGAGGDSFLPIQRSVLMMRRDLSSRPSWSERFFETVVHEFGHTLGLQHTLTSSTMSTEITRATTKAAPLAADDVAGISVLYPAPAFLSGTGVVSGRITMGGTGINLASVVAISATGPAISELTNPDGTYRLAGLPPGTYAVYVHSLPPALSSENTPANITPPSGPNGPLPSGPPFLTAFYPGAVTVTAGGTAADVNLDVAPQPNSPISAVQTYSFFGNNPVKPGFFSRYTGSGMLVAAGSNLIGDNAPVPGLTVSVLGNVDSVSAVKPYVSDPVNWIETDLALNTSSPDGPRHLLFSTPQDLYVLPTAYNVVSAPPPALGGAVPTGDGGLTITGATIGSYTRILFDGVPARVRSATDGQITVDLPAAPGGYQSAIAALNPDGQSSLFLQGDSPATYSYGPQPDVASLAVNPTSLPAGVDTFIEIDAANGNFVQDDTRVGFGSSDLLVRKVWVFSPARLLAEVSVAPGAQAANTTVTVTTGLRHYFQPYSFSILPPNPGQISLSIPAPAAGANWVYPGGDVTVTALNLPSPAPPLTAYLGGTAAPILAVNGNQVTFQVPPGFGTGLAVVDLQAGSNFSIPALVMVEAPPPVIAGVFADPVTSVSALHPALTGQTLTLVVYGLAPQGTAVAASRVRVLINGMDQAMGSVSPISGTPAFVVTFTVSPTAASGSPQPLVVMVDSHASAPFFIQVQPGH